MWIFFFFLVWHLVNAVRYYSESALHSVGTQSLKSVGMLCLSKKPWTDSHGQGSTYREQVLLWARLRDTETENKPINFLFFFSG